MPVDLPRSPAATDLGDPRPWTGRTVLYWLFGFFGLMFAANGVFVWLALSSWSGVEVDSSYAAGRQFPGEQRAADAQAALGWLVNGTAERSSDGRARIAVEARDARGVPLPGLTVTATLARPTDRKLDRTTHLQEIGAGKYHAVIEDVLAGQWTLELVALGSEGQRFKSRNRIYFRQ